MSAHPKFARELLVFGVLLIVSWYFYGFATGYRGIVDGDSWYMVASSSLGQFPACTGGVNFHNPWRPLHPSPICIITTLFGRDAVWFMNLSVISYGLAAYLWYGITRNVFRLNTTYGLLLGIIFLAYPDDDARYTLLGGSRNFGMTFTLVAAWLVLWFWDHRRAYWAMALGVPLALVGVLIYESPLIAWTIGVPLMLYYKERRISRCGIVVSTIVLLASLSYILWRFAILPGMYTEQTVITGTPTNPTLDPKLWFRQATDSYALLSTIWQTPVGWIARGAMTADTHFGIRAVIIGSFSALLAVCGIAAVWRLDRAQPGWVSPATLLIAGLIAIPLLGGMLYFVDFRILSSRFRTLNISYGGSLLILGLILSVPRRRLHQLAGCAVAAGLVLFMSISSGYVATWFQMSSAITCDFSLRLTAQIPRLPQNRYVVIRAFETRLTHRLDDAFVVSSLLAALYHEGPYSPDTYDYRRFGHTGYFGFMEPSAEIRDGDVLVEWSGVQTRSMHRRAPLPDILTVGNTLVLEYKPFQRLDVISAPNGLPTDVTEAVALTRAQEFCAWYDPAHFRDIAAQP